MGEERFSGSLLYQVVKGDLRFGTSHTERTVVLTGGVDQILRLNPRRLSFIICNRSLSVVDVAFSPTMLPGGGLMLMPNGGTFAVSWLEDGELAGSDLYGVGPEGATLHVIEVMATVAGGEA